MTIERTFYFGKFFLMLSVSMSFVIYGPFLRSLGLTAGDMALINAVFHLLVVVLDLPTSFFADRLGRTRSLMIGSAFLFLGLGWYALTRTLVDAVVAEVLAGIGIGFISGSLESWLKSALEKEEAGHPFRVKKRHDLATKRGTVAALAAKIIGGVGGGFLGYYSYRLPYVMELFFIVGCAPFLRKAMLKHEIAHTERIHVTLKEAWRAITTVPALRWFMAASMVGSLQQAVLFYWAMTFQTWIGQGGISLMWIPMQVCLTIGAHLLPQGKEGGKEDEKEHPLVSETGFLLTIAGINLSIWLMGASHSVAGRVVALLFFEVCYGARDQLFNILSARHVEHKLLTTYRAVPMTMLRLTAGLLLGIIWLCLRHTTFRPELILHLWMIIGAIGMIASPLLYVFRPREATSPALI